MGSLSSPPRPSLSFLAHLTHEKARLRIEGFIHLCDAGKKNEKRESLARGREQKRETGCPSLLSLFPEKSERERASRSRHVEARKRNERPRNFFGSSLDSRFSFLIFFLPSPFRLTTRFREESATGGSSPSSSSLSPLLPFTKGERERESAFSSFLFSCRRAAAAERERKGAGERARKKPRPRRPLKRERERGKGSKKNALFPPQHAPPVLLLQPLHVSGCVPAAAHDREARRRRRRPRWRWRRRSQQQRRRRRRQQAPSLARGAAGRLRRGAGSHLAVPWGPGAARAVAAPGGAGGGGPKGEGWYRSKGRAEAGQQRFRFFSSFSLHACTKGGLFWTFCPHGRGLHTLERP